MSVKQKLNVQRLGEKCQALKNLESGLSNKEVAILLNEVLYFSLLLTLNYLPLVSQCNKYSISFARFLNLLKTNILDFSTMPNIRYLELFHYSC